MMRNIASFAASVALMVTPVSAIFFSTFSFSGGKAGNNAHHEKKIRVRKMKRTAVKEQQRIADIIRSPEIAKDFNARCEQTGVFMLLWETVTEIDDVCTPGLCSPAGCVCPAEVRLRLVVLFLRFCWLGCCHSLDLGA